MIAFIGLLVGLLIVGLDQTTVSVGVATMAQDLGGLTDLPWIFTANLIAVASAAPLFGKLSDLYGRRRLFLIALVTFILGSALCGAAQDMSQLIAARAVQGVGAGGMTVMVIIVLGEMVPARARAGFQGYIGAELALASMVGPWFGGYLTDHASWRWIFWINVPLGIVALVVVAATLKIPDVRREARVDWIGAALLVGALGSLMLVFSWGGSRYEWDSAAILGLAAATIVLALLFVLAESRAPEPIVPLRLFKNRVVGLSLLLMFLAGASMFGIGNYIPAVLQLVTGVTATNSGLLILPMTLGIVATSILSGHVVAATGRYRWWPVVGTLVAAAGLWMLSRITPDTGRLQITVGMIVLGLGVGCIVQLMVVVVQNAVSMRDLGVATSTTGVSRIVGGAVGTGLFGAILSSRIGDAVAEHLPANALPPGVDPAFLARQPAMAAQMPPPVRDGLAAAYADVFSAIFTAAIPLALLAFVAALLIPQLPMRVRFDPDQVEAEPPPSDEVALD